MELEGDERTINNVARELELDTTNRIAVTYWDLFEDYKKQNNLPNEESIVFPQDHKSQIMGLDLPKAK